MDHESLPMQTQVMELVNGELRSAGIVLLRLTGPELHSVFPPANDEDHRDHPGDE